VEQLLAQNWTVYGAARQVDNIPNGVAQRFSFDAGKLSSFQEVALLLAHEIDALDRVIYAAGGIQYTKVLELGQQNWHNMMNINLHGAYYSIGSHLAPHARRGDVRCAGCLSRKNHPATLWGVCQRKSCLATHDGNSGKRAAQARFPPDAPACGEHPVLGVPTHQSARVRAFPSTAAERILNALEHEQQVIIDL
jgi:NAD(P)-dependent dehydrogenase (short-subunit alcohol dehydrogenase family)